jgi:hypothetical protein
MTISAAERAEVSSHAGLSGDPFGHPEYPRFFTVDPGTIRMRRKRGIQLSRFGPLGADLAMAFGRPIGMFGP